MKFLPDERYVVAFTKPDPYISNVFSYKKEEARSQAINILGMSWKEIYASGGRIIKVIVKECK